MGGALPSSLPRHQHTAARNRFVCLSIRARFECVVMLSCHGGIQRWPTVKGRYGVAALSLSLSVPDPGRSLGACTDKGRANKRSQNKTQTQLSSVAVLSQEHLGKVAKNLSLPSKLCRELCNKLNNLCNPRRRRVGLKTITKRNNEQPKRFTTTASNLQHGFHQGVASPYSPSSTLTHFSGRRKLLVAQHLQLQRETPTQRLQLPLDLLPRFLPHTN